MEVDAVLLAGLADGIARRLSRILAVGPVADNSREAFASKMADIGRIDLRGNGIAVREFRESHYE